MTAVHIFSFIMEAKTRTDGALQAARLNRPTRVSPPRRASPAS